MHLAQWSRSVILNAIQEKAYFHAELVLNQVRTQRSQIYEVGVEHLPRGRQMACKLLIVPCSHSRFLRPQMFERIVFY